MRNYLWQRSLAALAASVFLASCGGGGSGGLAALTPTLKGIAATGAALASATVTVHDATGTEVGSGTTGAAGAFEITLNKTGTAPYVLNVVKDDISLFAMAAQAQSASVNINQLSDAVVALVSPSGASEDLVARLQSGATAPTAAQIESGKALVNAGIAPVKAALSTTQDIFTEPFATNGTGLDTLLDSVSVNKIAQSAGSSGSANVQLTLNVATDPLNAQASTPVVNISSSSRTSDVSAEVASLPTITSADLMPADAAALYSSFVSNMNACYQDVPLVRTDGNATVRSAACSKIFYNNDPAQYRHAGANLGRSGAFPGLFTYGGRVQFRATVKPYLVQDLAGNKSPDGKGRAIVALSWDNSDGNRENILLYVTKYTDPQDSGKQILGASGDKNDYGLFVNSHNQKREFPLKADAAFDYVQGGYLLAIRDVIDADNNSIIKYATVTSPSKKVILFAPGAGGAVRDLQLCRSSEVNFVSVEGVQVPSTPKAATCTGSKFITFAERFISDTETRKPSAITNAGIIRPLNSAGAAYTPSDSELKDFPSVGLWTVTYTFNDPSLSAKTQKTWSVARPMTTVELLGSSGPDAVMPRYTPETIASLKALKTSSSVMTPCKLTWETCVASESPIPAPASGGLMLAWTGNSAVPMTSLWASGRLNDSAKSWIDSAGSTSWDDQINVSSGRTSAELKCSRQSSTDLHCADGVAVSASGAFNPYTWMSYSELWGKDQEQRSMMRAYNWYRPTF